jgi:glycosyltransferase involved in cell wall biosynthesis
MITAESPLVSVVVCTYNRPQLLRRALASILRQDLQDFEIIVVDDGSDAAIELPDDRHNRLRLLRTAHRGIGAARQEGLNAARGAFIAYCDDDDEWRPNHLSVLLDYLQTHPEVDLVYADSEWIQGSGPRGVPYSIDYAGGVLRWSNYIFATDVMHRAQPARDVGGFDSSLCIFEDWDLWLRMSEKYVLRHLPVVLAAHHWTEGCVSALQQWQDADRIVKKHHERMERERLADELAFCHDLIPNAAPVLPFDGRTWQPGRRELIWHSNLYPENSFGHTARRLLLALERRGVDVVMAPTRNQPVQSFERFFRPLDHWGRLAFYYGFHYAPAALKSQRTTCYSMWESTTVPANMVAAVNEGAVLLFVPCRQNVDSFRQSGVRVPIRVLHCGLEPAEFPYLERDNRDCFTFGTFGDFSPRKGIDVLLRAFRDEFSPDEPVRLLMKNLQPKADPAFHVDDPRITLVSGFMGREPLLDLLRRMDAFVLPSRGEGFGLCGLEAMSTGLPVIATGWSGPAEYLDPDFSYPLDYRLVDAAGIYSNKQHYFGRWAEPDYEHLRYLMRWLYEHPDEARQAGRRAAQQIPERWNWDRIAAQFCSDLDELAGLRVTVESEIPLGKE